ncbi:MAG: FtsQ-type POTRA domain-containing protein [Candidatus Latescibacterota bacterium]|nr:MAG: FtsQ-type POTRA domain-containing protein [Candidatus Latescibacterota bacterium]
MRVLIARLVTTAAIGILIVGAFQFYTFLTTSERLAVTRVTFDGLTRVDSTEIERLVSDMRGQNILLVPLEKCAARFEGHPRIRNVVFKKILPNRVVCTVEERGPVALVYAKRFLEVDEEGMIMTADGLTDLLDLPIITGLDLKSIEEGAYCREIRLIEALEILKLCKRYGGSFAGDISELRVGKSGISVVSLKEGMVLLLGESEYESRLKKFFLIRNTIAKRDESAKLIDLRFEDQVVLRSGI